MNVKLSVPRKMNVLDSTMNGGQVSATFGAIQSKEMQMHQMSAILRIESWKATTTLF